MGYRCFEVDITDRVAHVRLTRPEERNSMIPEFWRELPEIVTGISDDASARVVVISSTGRHFTAGMDLAVFTEGMRDDEGLERGRRQARTRSMVQRLQESFTALERARVPVIAAVQGGCVGGGVDMVCACDMRYATEDAFFVIQEINIGMTADVGTLQRLPKIIPAGVAHELAYTGRRLPAARAREVGLVNEVFPDHEAMLAGVLDIAGEIASKSPLAIWGTKEALTYARDHSVPEALDQIATWQSGAFQPEDMVEAFTARAQKREPAFADLPAAPTGL